MRTLLLSADNEVTYGGAELIDRWRQDESTRLWLDLCEQDSEQEQELLLSFDCHPLAVTDAMRDRHPPKIEAFENYTFILYRGIASFDESLEHQGQTLAFFVGERCLISRHPHPAGSVDRLMQEGGSTQLARSPAHLALRIMHVSAGIYLENLQAFEEQLSDLEDRLFEGGNDVLMRELIIYRSRLVKLRRTFNYHKNITDELRSGEYRLFPQEENLIHVIIDLHDRFERLHSLAQMYYELCGDLVNGYISISSHQLNSTMRILTVITAIFVPLGFLAGLYGMNFENMPELRSPDGYFILLAVMITLATGLLLLFRRIRWL